MAPGTKELSRRSVAVLPGVWLVVALVFVACSKPKFNNPRPLDPDAGKPAVSILRVTAVAPALGPVVGGTPLEITGDAFQAGAAVTLGTATCLNVVIVSPQLLRCQTPAHVAGSVGLTVTLSTGETASLASAYAFQLPPASSTQVVVRAGQVRFAGGLSVRSSADRRVATPAAAGNVQSGVGVVVRVH